jgi:hypothetical protein
VGAHSRSVLLAPKMQLQNDKEYTDQELKEALRSLLAAG